MFGVLHTSTAKLKVIQCLLLKSPTAVVLNSLFNYKVSERISKLTKEKHSADFRRNAENCNLNVILVCTRGYMQLVVAISIGLNAI